MKLLTPVHIPRGNALIDCGTKVLTIGSCFSAHIGERLGSHHFDVMTNPFGTVFNPVSLAKILTGAVSNDRITADDVDHYRDRFFHYDYHTTFDAHNGVICADQINKTISMVELFCRDLDVLILTFGTSIVYQHKVTKEVVSNCHKVPAKEFDRRYLSLTEMTKSIDNLIAMLRRRRPNLQVVLTVSPVRHTKEGMIDNQRSKSRLIELCHSLVERHEAVTYFPAYEIMIDELRDYRFFKEDMIHPSHQAIEEIWQRFVTSTMTEQAQTKVKRLRKLLTSLAHDPFNEISLENQVRVQKLLKTIEEVQSDYPEVNLADERLSFIARKSF